MPGIGRKTAIKLLTEYGSIPGIYEHIDEVKPPRAKKNLAEYRATAFEAKFLTTIKCDADISLEMDRCVFGDFARKDVLDVLTKLEFYSMISRIPASGDDGDSQQTAFDLGVDKPPVDYVIVDTEEGLESLVSAIATPAGFSFDTETTSQNPMTARLVGLSFSVEPYSGWYVPVGHSEGKQIPLDVALGGLGPVLADPDVPKTAHNANYDMMVLENHGVTVEGLEFDTMLAAHAADAARSD